MPSFYCDICGAVYEAEQESLPPTCSAICHRIYNEQKADEYARFYKWFKHTKHQTGSCFERDVLRDCKDALWDAWQKRAQEFDA